MKKVVYTVEEFWAGDWKPVTTRRFGSRNSARREKRVCKNLYGLRDGYVRVVKTVVSVQITQQVIR